MEILIFEVKEVDFESGENIMEFQQISLLDFNYLHRSFFAHDHANVSSHPFSRIFIGSDESTHDRQEIIHCARRNHQHLIDTKCEKMRVLEMHCEKDLMEQNSQP